VNNWAWLRNFS